MVESVARCRCGYELLEGQDCPECGRSFEMAHPLQKPRRAGTKAACAGLTAISIVLLGVPVLMLALVVGQNQNHPEAALSVMGPEAIAWIIATAALAASLLLAGISMKRHGFSGLLCFFLIADVVLLVPPLLLLFAIVM